MNSRSAAQRAADDALLGAMLRRAITDTSHARNYVQGDRYHLDFDGSIEPESEEERAALDRTLKDRKP